jgi:hypothetical protein
VCRTPIAWTVVSNDCRIVADNDSRDKDGIAGQFRLTDLALGHYTVKEKAAPMGYALDPAIKDADLTLAFPGFTISSPFVNNPLFQGKIAPTQTTCQDYVNGTAGDLTQVFYGVKSGKINNVAPGVLFYYTRVTATGSSFTIDVLQNHDANGNHSSIPAFGVQQVVVYTANCTTYSNRTIDASIRSDVKITVNGARRPARHLSSPSYSPGTVVGVTAPDPTTVHYDFKTFIGTTQVDQT